MTFSTDSTEKIKKDLYRLESLCLKFKRKDLAEHVISLCKKLSDRFFSIAVIGEFNRGKSTFINALLSTNLLPVSVRPSTSALTKISYAEKPSARIFKKDGSFFETCVEKLHEFSINSSGAENIERIEVFYPSDILKNGIEIFDTPGINDIGQTADDIVYGLLPGADALIFILDARQILSGSEMSFLKDHILKSDAARLFFILNKAELLDENEKKEALKYIHEKLHGLTKHPRIFMISSKLALNGKCAKDDKITAASMMPAFENSLFEFLSREREFHILRAVSYKASAIAENLSSAIGAGYFFSDRIAGEINLKIKAFESVVSDVESGRLKVESEIEERFEKLAAVIKKDAAVSRDSLKNKIIEKITDSDEDISRLKSLIFTIIRFERKKWFENELEKINILLKDVAAFIGRTAFSLTEKIVRFSGEKLGAIESRSKFNGEAASFDIIHAGEYNALEIITQLATIIFGANPIVSIAALLGSGMIISKIKNQTLKKELISKIDGIADDYFNRAGEEMLNLVEKQKRIYISHFNRFIESYSLEVRNAMNEAVIEKKISGFEAERSGREERHTLDELRNISDGFLEGALKNFKDQAI